MTHRLILATASGISVCERDTGDWRIARSGLEGRDVTCAIGREGVILAGTSDGIFRSDDQGASWREASRGLSIRHVRWLAFHPSVSDLEFAGTEPAGIFVSRDGGESWTARPEVAELRDKHRWSLPYSPEAGCVRGFAFHGPHGFAAVEVGGVLVSGDQGESWRLAEGSDGNPNLAGPPEPYIYPDVHSIEVHPSSHQLVFAPTGGGFYRSRDAGQSWELLYDCYCRAAWIDAADPNHIILGPADNVDTNGRIEESRNGGRTWQQVSTGLKLPWRRHMVERFAQAGDELLAVLSNGGLLAAPLAGLEWRSIVGEIKDVQAVAVVSEQ